MFFIIHLFYVSYEIVLQLIYNSFLFFKKYFYNVKNLKLANTNK